MVESNSLMMGEMCNKGLMLHLFKIFTKFKCTHRAGKSSVFSAFCSLPSCLLCRSLSFPCSRHALQGSAVFHRTSDSRERTAARAPGGIPHIILGWTCKSAALCHQTSATAPKRRCRGTGEVCVTAGVWMLQRQVWKASSRGNSRGYCRPPWRSVNWAGRRQLICAVLWSVQQSLPLTFMSAKFTQKCFFFLNPP